MSATEWQTRCELAAGYRLMDLHGMTDMIYNHITLRIPGTEHLLINFYGLLCREITAASLTKIDVEGNIISKPDTDYGINKIRLRHPRRHPPGAAGCGGGDPHPHQGWNGCGQH